MKKILAVLLSMVLVLSVGMQVQADGTEENNGNGQSYLVTGADLSKEQWDTVLSLLDIKPEEVSNYVQLQVTNEEEHQYLDEYLPASVIGSKAYSSVKIVPGEEGSGLEITTYNINYCTIMMYKNALITAGLKDAEVTVAGPFELSGTAALIGAVKGYADSKGEEVNEEALETATNELVLTGSLGEDVGDSEAIADLMAYAKQMVVEKDLSSEEDIREAVLEGAEKLDLDLSEEQVDDIVALMQKVSQLDIDENALKEQAKDLYDKLSDIGFDFGDVDTDGIMESIKEVIRSIIVFFEQLFG